MEGEKRNGLKKPQTRRRLFIHPDESPLGRLNQTASGSRYGGSLNQGFIALGCPRPFGRFGSAASPRSPRRSIFKLHTRISIRLDLNQIEVKRLSTPLSAKGCGANGLFRRDLSSWNRADSLMRVVRDHAPLTGQPRIDVRIRGAELDIADAEPAHDVDAGVACVGQAKTRRADQLPRIFDRRPRQNQQRRRQARCGNQALELSLA